MIQIFYTGALAHLQAQPYSSNSLGGFISSTPIPNGRVNSIFSDTCYYQKHTEECKLIVLTNNSTSVATNIKVWIETNGDTSSSYSIAAILPTSDICGNPCFEKILQSTDLPLYATFSNSIDIGSALSIASLQAGISIGVWIKRLYDRNSTQNVQLRNPDYMCTNLSVDDFKITNKEKSFNLVVDFS